LLCSRGCSFLVYLPLILMIPDFLSFGRNSRDLCLPWNTGWIWLLLHGTVSLQQIQCYGQSSLHLWSLSTIYLLHKSWETIEFCRHVTLPPALVLQKALRKAHIWPRSGRKYAVGHIVAVIEYAFGAMPSLVCKNGSVQELRLCFHKDYQVGSFYKSCQFLNLWISQISLSRKLDLCHRFV
jgi:hypothetical protein